MQAFVYGQWFNTLTIPPRAACLWRYGQRVEPCECLIKVRMAYMYSHLAQRERALQEGKISARLDVQLPKQPWQLLTQRRCSYSSSWSQLKSRSGSCSCSMTRWKGRRSSWSKAWSRWLRSIRGCWEGLVWPIVMQLSFSTGLQVWAARSMRPSGKVSAFMNQNPRKVAAFVSECLDYRRFEASDLLPYATRETLEELGLVGCQIDTFSSDYGVWLRSGDTY